MLAEERLVEQRYIRGKWRNDVKAELYADGSCNLTARVRHIDLTRVGMRRLANLLLEWADAKQGVNS